MIYIIDLGSQYTMLIARRIRELGVYSEIVAPSVILTPSSVILSDSEESRVSVNAMKKCNGIILSGGPSSAYEEKVKLNREIFGINKPILGICLGMQIIAHLLKGKVLSGKREYGKTKISLDTKSKLFKGLPSKISCWMSHGDRVSTLPKAFKSIAKSDEIEIAGMEGRVDESSRTEGKLKPSLQPNIFGLQFHPEVVHTEKGDKILRNFVFNICKAKKEWTPKYFIKEKIEEIQKKVQDKKVIVGLSGGVDSAVTCALLYRAIGDRCIPIFVDTGLMRMGEKEEIEKAFKNVHFVDAQDDFLSALSGITDPEEKRKIIGRKFIKVFEREAKKFSPGRGWSPDHPEVKFLAQGTLYPDRIESHSQVGPSATIKSHHNVGGLPEKMGLALIEPLRDLFKDEVRKIGKLLKLPDSIIGRHPFPGPGLAVRIIGDITKGRVRMLQQADAIYIEELRKTELYDKIWQAFAVLLPVKSVGVMGDKRSYENVVALRAVVSVDGMTSAPFKFPWDVLLHTGDRIVREVTGINRVVYDITSKPPATIEWE